MNKNNFCLSLAADITDTTETSIVPALAGYRAVITSITVTNSHATVGTVVKIYNGAALAAAPRIRNYATAVGGGFAQGSLLVEGEVNTAWLAACETTGAAVQITVSGVYVRV